MHSESISKLNLEILKGSYTAILHVGDFGYDLEDTISQGPHAGENVSFRFEDNISVLQFVRAANSRNEA